jgi:hypothetical protein
MDISFGGAIQLPIHAPREELPAQGGGSGAANSVRIPCSAAVGKIVL